MNYLGDTSPPKVFLNDYGSTETNTRFSFLASDKGVSRDDMHIYMYHEPWASKMFCRVWLNSEGIFVLSGNVSNGPAREQLFLGANQYGDTYSITVDFNFPNRTQTVSATNLTDPGQVLTTQVAYFSEDNGGDPMTLELAKNLTLRLISVSPAAGVKRSMWDNVSFAPIPEPSALLALASGLVALAGVRMRRRR